MPLIRNLARLSVAVGMLAAGSVQAADVDVMRLNMNLTVRTDDNQGQKRQVNLGSKQLINLAKDQELNDPVQDDLVLGMSCEESPRVVIIDKSGTEAAVVLGTVTTVQGGVVTGPVDLGSKPFDYQLVTLNLDPVGGIDDGVLQMVVRSKDHGQSCPKNAHISTISGWISYHTPDDTVDPGIVIRGVANVVPPVLGTVPEPVVAP